MSAPQPGTPLPWYVGNHPYAPAPRYIHIMPFNGSAAVAKAYSARPKDAAYIVHACNNYPKAQALADALRDMLEMRELHLRDRVHPKGEMQVVAESRAALAAWDAKP